MADETRKSSYKKSTSTTTRRAGHRMSKKERGEAQESFLKSFAANGNVRAACTKANVDRATVRQWEEHDVDFSIKYNLAKEDVNDAIRGEIYSRAMFGVERYVVSMGKVVFYQDKPLTIKEKSDTLLMFHAKARMPEYRDKGLVVNNILPKEYVNLPEDGTVME